MSDHQMDLILKYPTILPNNSELTEFHGCLPVNGVDYAIHIQHADTTPVLEINPQLQPFQKDIALLLQEAKDMNVVALLDNVKQIISGKPTTNSCTNLSETYRHILTEYMELQQFYIGMHACTISSDLFEIQISQRDENNLIHDLVIGVDRNEFYVKQHPFPETKDELFQRHSSLKAIYEKFLNMIEKLQDYFHLMDRLDSNCNILDPEKPSSKDCYRRIGLLDDVSMLVTFDPWNYRTIPDIKFLGPTELLKGYRRNVVTYLIHWQPDGDVFKELLKLLGLSRFPPRIDNSTKDILLYNNGECCICFSLRLNNRLPEIICENESCKQYFHTQCLYQWLISINATTALNELHGKCPNCDEPISCPVVEMPLPEFNLRLY